MHCQGTLSHALLCLCSRGPGMAWPACVCTVFLRFLQQVEGCTPEAWQQVQRLSPCSAATGVLATAAPLSASFLSSASVDVRPSEQLHRPADHSGASSDCHTAWSGLDGTRHRAGAEL